jgi:hypothetical protein
LFYYIIFISYVSDIVTKEVDRYNGRKEAFLENVLQPWSKYEFKMVAGNSIGFGEVSLPSPQVNTPADRPYKAPTNITGGGGKIGDLTIVWKVCFYHDFLYYFSKPTNLTALIFSNYLHKIKMDQMFIIVFTGDVWIMIQSFSLYL